MINWLWVIPWILVLIFYAGWHFGGKVSVRKESRERVRELENQQREREHSRTISALYQHLDELENKIEQIRFTKEETKDD